MKLEEIKETLRIHNELAPSQLRYLIARVEKLEAALKEIVDDKYRGNKTCWIIARNALAQINSCIYFGKNQS